MEMSSEIHYNLFLDDYRHPLCLKDTRAWTTVKNYKEFVAIIEKQGLPAFISFDHDLSFEHYPLSVLNLSASKIPYDLYKEKTGYHCAQWLVDHCQTKKLPLPDYQVHSMNPVGKENIISLLENFKEYQSKTTVLNIP